MIGRLVGPIILAFALVGPVLAATYISEGWEIGTPPASWPYKDAPDPCPAAWEGNIWNGWDPGLADYCSGFPEWALTGLSTAEAHGGTRSFFINRVAGKSESGDIVKEWSAPYPAKIYIRFFLYLDANFINFNTPTTREPSYHFLFTNSALSLTGLRINILSKVPWTTPHSCGANEGNFPFARPYAFFSVQDYDREWPVGTYPDPCYNLLDHLSEWQEIEIMMDAATDTVTIWAGGAQVYTGTDRITDASFHSIQISNYMSSEDGTGFDTSYSIDDILVSDEFIALGSGDTTPPSAPANLAVE